MADPIIAMLNFPRIDPVNGFDLYEDFGGSVFACPPGSKQPIGSAWGPAADGTGEWFASRWLTETGPVRVADRAAAIAYITEAVARG